MAVLLVATTVWQTAMHALGGSGIDAGKPMLYTAGESLSFTADREPPANNAEAALDRIIPTVDLPEVPLGDAIDSLRDSLEVTVDGR